MKATINGSLNPVPDCMIVIPTSGRGKQQGFDALYFNNLPDISDSKSAVYNNEGIIGRSFPLYTYSHSADRSINIQLHFFVIEPGDGARNLAYLRLIQSCVYPRKGRGGAPYTPPPVCRIRCGDLLATQGEAVCAVLQSYSVKFPTDVAWDDRPDPSTGQQSYCPYRFDVDTSWLAVYTSSDLPYQRRIIQLGR
jgi:hypothetical protein